MPSVPALVELMLVVAAIAVLWPFFEQVAQLGGAGRDQRFLDRGIAVAGLPDAIVPAACESVGSLAEARVADALCGSRRKASARPPTHLPGTVAQAIARASEAFQRPLRDAEQRALGAARAGRRRRRRAARASPTRSRRSRPTCSRSVERFQLAGADAAGPRPLRCAARWAEAALAAGFPPARRPSGIAARANARAAARRRARRPARHGAARRRGAAAARAARAAACARRGASRSPRTAALMADARQSRRTARARTRRCARCCARPAGNGRRRWRSATPSALRAGARLARRSASRSRSPRGRSPRGWPRAVAVRRRHARSFPAASTRAGHAPAPFVLALARRGGWRSSIVAAAPSTRARPPPTAQTMARASAIRASCSPPASAGCCCSTCRPTATPATAISRSTTRAISGSAC